MVSETLAQEILNRREHRLQSLASVSRQVCPRASSITSCDREMVYSITNWDKRPAPDLHLMARFEEGREQERKVIRELLDLGFEIVEGQKPFEIKDRKGRVALTGHIDGMALWKDKKVPFEVKSLDPNIYNQIDKVEDFNKYEWAKRYPLQMQSYLFGNNEDEGLFIITDCKGHWKLFPVTLNLELVERILQRCEYVVYCVIKEKLPEFHKDISICKRCWALGRVCTPPMDFGEGMQIIEDPEMEILLEKWTELKPSEKEYKEIDNHIKKYFKGRPNSICGNFVITGKAGIMKKAAQEAQEISTWRTKIERIKT